MIRSGNASNEELRILFIFSRLGKHFFIILGHGRIIGAVMTHPDSSPANLPALASLRRRLASLLYECLTLAALWFIAGFLVVGLLPRELTGMARLLFQAYLILVAGGYFMWFWRRGGQTLAMKTWRLRLVDTRGGALTPRQALARFALAALGTLCLGAGFLWALVDRDRQFLHDRVAGTRVARVPPE
jgi:uncharacterized RDD family membrane protein YckC